MKVIKIFDILLEYALALGFAVCLVLAVFNTWYLAVAGALLAAYFIWGAVRLRCPWCGSTVELDVLLRGARGRCNCPGCGHELTVVWRVRKKLSARARRRRDGE